MREWIGKIRHVPKYKSDGFYTEEIIDISDDWVIIETKDKGFIFTPEKITYKSNKELIDALKRLKYK